jgi:hypothetical protein
MDVGAVGDGMADLFVYQTRAFLDQIAGFCDRAAPPDSIRACTGCA